MARILHVLPGPRAEGTPRLVLDWLSAGVHEHDLLFLNPEGELKSEFLAKNVWQRYNDKFAVSFFAARQIARLTEEVCLERKPDIVISWPMGFSQWIHWGARRAGIKKLIVHSGNPPGTAFVGRYIYTYLSFWIGYFLGSKVICCSDYIKNEFGRIPFLSKKMFIRVYNCINVKRFVVKDPVKKPGQVVMVATMETHKDHETLLKAWRIIEDRGHPYKLVLAGSGTLEEKLKDTASELKLSNVHFIGSRENIPVLMNESPVFVLSTTIQEGFGTVLLEALASQCTVVATDVPACREVLQSGKFGTLTPPANEQALADAIIAAMQRQQTTKEDSEKAAYVLQFTPEIMMQAYVDIANRS